MDNQQFGPNGDQVRRFLDAIPQVADEQWSVLEAGRDFYVDWRDIEHGVGYEGRAHFAAAYQALYALGLSPTHFLACVGALAAVVNARVLPQHQFALLYARFGDIVPVGSLGPGHAPTAAEQIAAVFHFAATIDGGRSDAREATRNLAVLWLTLLAGLVGIPAAFLGGTWGAPLALLSIVVLLGVSLWGQLVDTAWTTPWRR